MIGGPEPRGARLTLSPMVKLAEVVDWGAVMRALHAEQIWRHCPGRPKGTVDHPERVEAWPPGRSAAWVRQLRHSKSSKPL